MDYEEDYLGRMPFTIVFIDPIHSTFKQSARKLNDYISRHPPVHSRLHQPQFAGKILEMAAHQNNMRVFVRKADAQIKHELHFLVRKGVFASDEEMWAFINQPDNLATVKNI